MKADEKRARALVAQRSGLVCEGCGLHRATEWSHRKRRSQMGRWLASNGMHVCHLTHQWISENPTDAAVLGWLVWSWQDPAVVPVKLFGHGWVLLRDDGSVVPCAPPERSVA